VIVICGLLIGLVIVGTTVDFVLQQLSSPPEKAKNAKIVPTTVYNKETIEKPQHSDKQVAKKDFILSFSLCKTVPNLVSTKQSPSTIEGLNAVKIFFNSIIVVHHIYTLCFLLLIILRTFMIFYQGLLFSQQ